MSATDAPSAVALLVDPQVEAIVGGAFGFFAAIIWLDAVQGKRVSEGGGTLREG